FDFCFIVASDQNSVSSSGSIQFVTKFGHLTAEAFDRLDAKMTACLDRGRRQCGKADAGKANELPQYTRHREKPACVGHALEIILALFAQVVGFDEDGPGLAREVVAKMAGVSQRRRVLAVAFGAGAMDRGAGYFDDLEFLQTSLRLWRELTDRFNFV